MLPLAFHSIPRGGQIFLPMHIPVLICGIIAGPIFALLCGILTPLLSSLITGMPTFAVLPGMLFELSAYGFFSGLIIRLIKSPSKILDIYIALVLAMLIGRVIGGLMNGLIFSAGAYSLKTWLMLSFVTALPGIVIQLTVIPTIIYSLRRANIIYWEDDGIWGVKYRLQTN